MFQSNDFAWAIPDHSVVHPIGPNPPNDPIRVNEVVLDPVADTAQDVVKNKSEDTGYRKIGGYFTTIMGLAVQHMRLGYMRRRRPF